LDKAPDAFRTISEVAEEIDVPQHVLRFWESRFTQIRPMKRGGGRRYYRPDDVDLLRGIRHLLYGEGYTIRGVQRILREEGAAIVQNVWRAGAQQPPREADDVTAGEDLTEGAAEAQTEPGRTPFGFSASRAQERPGKEPSAERREPVLAPPVSSEKAMRHGVTAEDRRRLQAVLDDLVACRHLIETALAEHAPNESIGRSAEI
jgi:DNA-binding transcriptional MerR regulator